MEKSDTKAKKYDYSHSTRPHRTATRADSHVLRCHGWPSVETRCAPSSGAINGACASPLHEYARLVHMEKSGTMAKKLWWPHNSPTLHSDTHRAVGDRVLWGPGATKLTWEFESPYPYLCSLTRRHCHEVHRGPHEPTRLPLLYPTRRRARLAGRKLDNLRARALLPLPMRGVAATCAASIQANH